MGEVYFFVRDGDIAVEFRFNHSHAFWSGRKLRIGTSKQSSANYQCRKGTHYGLSAERLGPNV
jgi:hypothetical protein